MKPMPRVFEKNGYKFFFFANEGNPREPLHVHARKGERAAKYWLHPEIALADNYGFNSSELRWIEEQVVENRAFIEEKWHEFFGP